MWKLIIVLFIFIFQSIALASVMDLGTYGTTYPIEEPDMLTEIEERVKDPAVQKRAVDGLKKALANYSHPMGQRTPWASTDSVHYIDPTYTLPYDIPNGFGGFLYRKGYQINPLKSMDFNQTILIVDPEDKRQLLWLKEILEKKNLSNPMILLSFGHMIENAQKFTRPVYALTKDISQKFKIDAVPVVITQAGDIMKVQTFKLKNVENGENEEN